MNKKSLIKLVNVVLHAANDARAVAIEGQVEEELFLESRYDRIVARFLQMDAEIEGVVSRE